MSSLQKFHRRTIVVGGGVVAPFLTVGSGSDTIGYRLGYASGSSAYLIVAPKSTEPGLTSWGSNGVTRGTTSTTNGALNTATLYGFGSVAHPLAYNAKSLTTGGYNTWYMPASDELLTMYSNKSVTPFSTANALDGAYYWSSTEKTATTANALSFTDGTLWSYQNGPKIQPFSTRAVRQYYAPAAIGDGSATTGYWLGTAGDGVSKLIVAPKSTEVRIAWGSYGTTRNTTSTTNGLANTNTLYAFGSAAHPAAYYAKTLTSGGYNTWYLPSKAEVLTMLTNKNTAISFVGDYYWTSTERDNQRAFVLNGNNNNEFHYEKSNGNYYVRATRRSTI